MEKIAVFAPMPSASVMTATAVKPGFLANILIPYLKSWRSVVILFLTCFEWSGAKRLKRKG